MENKTSEEEWHTRRFIFNEPTYPISIMSGSLSIANVYPYPTQKAGVENARLISAAPELLDACLDALNYCSFGPPKIYNKLREAIKKATVCE